MFPSGTGYKSTNQRGFPQRKRRLMRSFVVEETLFEIG
jgi:hypothetical protein